MTDLTAALADVTKLHPFEGKQVLRTGISLRNAGDGLSKAMKVEPREFTQGDEVYFVIKGVVTDVKFKPIADDDPKGPQERIHSIRAGTATWVSPDEVLEMIDAQEDRIIAAMERAKGIEPIPGVKEAAKEAKRTARTKGKAEAEADPGVKPTPSAPEPGATDADGFHDPALASTSPPASLPVKKAAAKAAATPKA